MHTHTHTHTHTYAHTHIFVCRSVYIWYVCSSKEMETIYTLAIDKQEINYGNYRMRH